MWHGRRLGRANARFQGQDGPETHAQNGHATGILGDVGDGAEAKQRARRDRFDLVISDVEMPGATGYDVFAATEATDPNTPVILVMAFGYDPSHSIVKANREGLSAVLMKPFKVDDLLNQVRQALAR